MIDYMYKVYAYDFFDTIVHRTCHSETVLFLWAKRLSKYLQFFISPSELYDIRKRKESQAKKELQIEELQYNDLISLVYNNIDGIESKISKDDFIDKSYEIEL